LPILLPLKSLTINVVADVADFSDLHINLVFLGLLNRNPPHESARFKGTMREKNSRWSNLNLETGNLACRAILRGNFMVLPPFLPFPAFRRAVCDASVPGCDGICDGLNHA
jgi:hypothetical protein